MTLTEFGNYLKGLKLPGSAWKRLKGCDRHTTKITREDAFDLIEDVIDTLVEVGNGTTEEELHEAADKLFVVRDCFIKKE